MQDESLEKLQKEFNDYKTSKENEIKELELKNKQLESEKHDLEVSNQTLNNLKLHQEVKTFKKSILEDIE